MRLPRIRPRLALILLLAALSCLSGPAAWPQDEAASNADVSAQAPGNIMFILDVSGSMWGQVDGRAKIEIARESMAALIESLPSGINAGLTAYGHRREGDCNDVEELVPLQPLDRGLLMEHINALTPLGKTPITRSIQLVAESLRGLEMPTTILLVSDGKETCDGDPCALAGELRASGIKVVIDVIGFDVTDEEREQLMCIAEQGGGTYYDASSVEEFMQAAQSSVDKPEFTGANVHVTALRNGEEIQTFVHVLNAEGEEIDLRLTTPGQGETIRLVPGDYTIVVQDTDTVGEPSITLPVTVESENVELTADFTSGTIRVTTTRNGEPRECSIRVLALETGEELAYTFSDQEGNVGEVNIPAGTYDVEVSDRRLPGSPVVLFPAVSVNSGEITDLTADFRTGWLEVNVTRNETPVQGDTMVYTAEGSLLISENSSPSEPARYELPVGRYSVKAVDMEAGSHVDGQEFPVTINDQETLRIDADFALGELHITAPGASGDAEVIVYAPGTDNFLVLEELDNGQATVLLMPGTYRVQVRDYASDASQMFEEVTITPGTSVSLEAHL